MLVAGCLEAAPEVFGDILQVPFGELVSDDLAQHGLVFSVCGRVLQAERVESLDRALLVGLGLLVGLAPSLLELGAEELVKEKVVAVHEPVDPDAESEEQDEHTKNLANRQFVVTGCHCDPPAALGCYPPLKLQEKLYLSSSKICGSCGDEKEVSR